MYSNSTLYTYKMALSMCEHRKTYYLAKVRQNWNKLFEFQSLSSTLFPKHKSKLNGFLYKTELLVK